MHYIILICQQAFFFFQSENGSAVSSVVQEHNVDIIVAELCSAHTSTSKAMSKSKKLSTKCPYTVVETLSDDGYDMTKRRDTIQCDIATMQVIESTQNCPMRSSSGPKNNSGLVTIENGALLIH